MYSQDQLQFVLNSLGGGPSAVRLLNAGMDPGVLRPWLGPDGRSYITVNDLRNFDPKTGKPKRINLVTNTPALLRREDWQRIDRQVQWEAKQRLRFWESIYTANPYVIPNGMGVLAVQHAVATGSADAIISMDPIRRSERSRPVLDTVSIPLPVIHSDNNIGIRQLAVSRNSDMPLDVTNIALSGRAVGEVLERLALGTSASFSFAGGTVYGALNFPQRLTATFTSPETGGYAFSTFVNELLAAIQLLKRRFFYGPYDIYYSTGWSRFFGMDYSALYPNRGVLARLREIEGIRSWTEIDFLPDFTMILMQRTPDVIEGINGMDITTVAWEESGGFESIFKVLCIQVPRIRATYSGNCGILHISAGTPTTTTSTSTTTSTTTTS